jgi:two-component system, cell cycle sensor histidine kinase and response regulator CckA
VGAVNGGVSTLGTLLVAEDAEAVRTVVVKLLECEGYRVLAARNGEEALRILSERGDTIDLALLDVVMPKITGPEIYELIRDRYARLKVLFTSGYGEGLVQGKPIASSQMLRKPYLPEELLRRIRDALAAGAAA